MSLQIKTNFDRESHLKSKENVESYESDTSNSIQSLRIESKDYLQSPESSMDDDYCSDEGIERNISPVTKENNDLYPI